jgi:predicted Rossmann-fold nucleotide-binding protein
MSSPTIPSPLDTAPHVVKIDPKVVKSAFIQKPSEDPLRITCYGSSSSKTPEKYLTEARNLGYILARRGHTCVNGAGSFGCMAAMNDGAATGEGHIVGVIHEMWLVDGNDWVGEVRDGGAHKVFHNKNEENSNVIREMLVAGGDDLQERKRLLVENANGLVVLPGGPGTWDECEWIFPAVYTGFEVF